jgi:hypothetical protein
MGVGLSAIGRVLHIGEPAAAPEPPPPVPSPPSIPSFSPDETARLRERVRREISDGATLRAILATLPNVNPDDPRFSQFVVNRE